MPLPPLCRLARPLTLLLALAGNLPAAQAEIWHCDRDPLPLSFTEDDDGRPLVSLQFADGEVRLPQVPTATGALYRNEAVRLHVQGDRAVFEDGRGNRRSCQAGPPPPVINSSFIEVSGEISAASMPKLPRDTRLHIDIVQQQPPQAALTLAEKHFRLAGLRTAIPFATSIDRDLLRSDARLRIRARVEHQGKTLLSSEQEFTAETASGLTLLLDRPASHRRPQATSSH